MALFLLEVDKNDNEDDDKEEEDADDDEEDNDDDDVGFPDIAFVKSNNKNRL